MPIISTFNDYRKNKKYKTEIENIVMKIISDSTNKRKIEIDSDDLNEISRYLLFDQKRIVNEIDKWNPITDNELQSKNDDITQVINVIQDDIIYEFYQRGYSSCKSEDGIIKLVIKR